MRVTTLIDNRPAPQLTAEWGLAFWIEYQDKHILLDTGGGENFARNAAALGIYLSRADFAVLSHAHWDHADGLPAFFRRNPTAPLYLRQGCGEDCYDRTDRGWRYEGIRKGTLAEYADRIRFVSGPFSPTPHRGWPPRARWGRCTACATASIPPMISPMSRAWSFRRRGAL